MTEGKAGAGWNTQTSSGAIKDLKSMKMKVKQNGFIEDTNEDQAS